MTIIELGEQNHHYAIRKICEWHLNEIYMEVNELKDKEGKYIHTSREDIYSKMVEVINCHLTVNVDPNNLKEEIEILGNIRLEKTKTAYENLKKLIPSLPNHDFKLSENGEILIE